MWNRVNVIYVWNATEKKSSVLTTNHRNLFPHNPVELQQVVLQVRL